VAALQGFESVRKTTTITPGRQRTRPCGSGCRCQYRSRRLRKWVCFVVFAKCRILNDFGRSEKENMGRYYWNKKNTVEDYRSVSISFLKRYDYFCGYRSGRIVWKNCYDEEKGSIGIAVSTTDSEKYARFYYTVTDRSSGEETDYDYKVNLTTTPCNFGGVRYWFICPLSIFHDLEQAEPDYAQQIARFKKVHTRVSLKAGTPEAFTRKTGAAPESFELPFQGIVNLIEAGASFHVAAMSADSRIVDRHERQSLLDRLASIDTAMVDNLEEEVVGSYHNTLERLRHASVKLAWD
jgi:hypothetical protein